MTKLSDNESEDGSKEKEKPSPSDTELDRAEKNGQRVCRECRTIDPPWCSSPYIGFCTGCLICDGSGHIGTIRWCSSCDRYAHD